MRIYKLPKEEKGKETAYFESQVNALLMQLPKNRCISIETHSLMIRKIENKKREVSGNLDIDISKKVPTKKRSVRGLQLIVQGHHLLGRLAILFGPLMHKKHQFYSLSVTLNEVSSNIQNVEIGHRDIETVKNQAK